MVTSVIFNASHRAVPAPPVQGKSVASTLPAANADNSVAMAVCAFQNGGAA
ncbi:hypothetical protein EC845_0687 [Comamonas sp. BIGb0124]|uniref:hypothetical protein n=1 Tax=Comamonas sp. BIGb0124 TaxID=2485130 RepID=UPI000FA0D919|nr:hypothetical protein [Comamonas sp. BIGb0124]ROR24662.1 hypothetical protein EC845_0687 [Comamonas sp. BIGb0124]